MKYLAFLELLAANLGLVKPLFDLAQTFFAAPTWKARWEAIKAIGDVLVPVIDKDPGLVVTTGDVAVMSAEAQAEYDAKVLEIEQLICAEMAYQPAGPSEVTAQAWDGSKLRKIFAMIEVLLPLLLAK